MSNILILMIRFVAVFFSFIQGLLALDIHDLQSSCELRLVDSELRVGMGCDYVYPFSGFDVNNTGECSSDKVPPELFEVKIADYICSALNVTCKYVGLQTLEDNILKLQDNTVDMVISRFSVTKERADNVTFVSPYYYADGTQLFTSLDRVEDFGTSMEEKGWEGTVNGEKICVKKNYPYEDVLEAMGAEIINNAGKTVKERAEALKQQQCSLLVTDESEKYILGQYEVEPVPNTDTRYILPYAIAVSKRNSILQREISGKLQDLFIRKDRKSKSEIQLMEEKYIVQGSDQVLKPNEFLASQVEILSVEIGQVQLVGELVIGLLNINVPPLIQHTRSKSGKIVFDKNSFEYKIAASICSELNYTCTYKELQLGNQLEVLKRGDVDVVIAQYAATRELVDVVSFIEPFYYSTKVVLYSSEKFAESDELTDRIKKEAKIKRLPLSYDDLLTSKDTCCVPKNFFSNQRIQLESKSVQYQTIKELKELVKNGDCTFVVGDLLHADEWAKHGIVRLKNVKPLVENPLGIAIQKGNVYLFQKIWPKLQRLFNKGTIVQMLESSTGYDGEAVSQEASAEFVHAQYKLAEVNQGICIVQ